ncbi:MAG: hypothetical protein AB7U79_06330 [Candidatus Izemoplasmatales bacterium]
MSKEKPYQEWYKLDNSAKIFPEVSNTKETNTFRVQIALKETLDPDTLQKAVDHVLERYPMFKVRLKTGIFWRYFDYNTRPFIVEPMSHMVCGPLLPKDNNGYLFKVFYRNNILAIEMFHSLADGGGAYMFLKSIVYEYFVQRGYKVTPDNMILTTDSRPTIEEYEDSNVAYYDPKNRKHVNEKKALGIKGTPLGDSNIGLISGCVSTKKILEISRSHQATVTEFLVAIMMMTIYNVKIKHREHQKYHQKPVKIFVPVNLRNHLPSKTLRNFSNFTKTDMVMNRPDITFEEVLALAKEQLRYGLQKDELIRKMSENVAFEKNIILRITPFHLKKFVMKLGYSLMGLSLNTMSFTNIGRIDFPESMKPYIDNVSAAVYSGKFNTFNCAIVSFEDKFKITFTRSIVETSLEKEFFRSLNQMGLDVKIESNYVEEYL